MTSPLHSFIWCGKNQMGQWVKGQMRTVSADSLRHTLMTQRIRMCVALRVPLGLQPLFTAEPNHSLKPRELTPWVRQLATLLQAGLPLLQSLRLMAQGVEQQARGQVALALSRHIEAGHSLSDALRDHGLFDPTFHQMIEAGELSGQLDRMLQRLALHREKSDALQRRLRAALLYPCIILTVGILVSALLLGFVVPAFEQMFQSMGGDLPWLTQIVLRISRGLINHGGSLALLALLVFFGLHYARMHTTWGQRVWDKLRLKLPILSALTRHAQSARWCRTLSTLLQSGIAIDQALTQIQRVMDHGDYRLATQRIHDQLTRGLALSRALSAHPQLFDSLLIQMCAVGEESGTLDTLLAQMAEHHEQAVDALTQRLATLLEPTIMLVLGLTMGTLVLAMYWPIFEIGQIL